MEYLKKAAKTPETESGAARKVVDEMLAAIRKGPEIGEEIDHLLTGKGAADADLRPAR